VNGNSGILAYVLITPARDEEATIEKCIQAVAAQTMLPKRWVVVSDGSTDRTDEIVCGCCRCYNWLRLIRVAEREGRHFGAKVRAFNAGLNAVGGLRYDVIGNLDADITFGEDYFEFLMGRFLQDPLLGVVGTPFVEDGSQYDYRFTSIEHVSGACQLFRRECFEQIGGYVPIEGGGIDWTAVTTARMKGWRTRTFPERVCYHHRKIGTGGSGSLSTWFRRGKKDYFLGGHPLWQLLRGCYQMTRRPFLIGGLLLLSGYLWGWISKAARPVSGELMAFHRKEQMSRLRRFLFKERA
jgi:biofilm PGA synthesis N-glycosyltransferase PgaC